MIRWKCFLLDAGLRVLRAKLRLIHPECVEYVLKGSWYVCWSNFYNPNVNVAPVIYCHAVTWRMAAACRSKTTSITSGKAAAAVPTQQTKVTDRLFAPSFLPRTYAGNLSITRPSLFATHLLRRRHDSYHETFSSPLV